MIDTGDYLKKKIIRQENMQEIDMFKEDKQKQRKVHRKVVQCIVHGEDKGRLQKMVRDRYRGLSEEEKNKTREYARSRYHNVSKAEKQKENRSKSSLRYVSTRERRSMCLFRSNNTRLNV